MSTIVVQSLVGLVDKTHALMLDFIETCPDKIWKEKFGGWPVWQQLVHSIGSYNFFILEEGNAPLQFSCSQDVGSLKVQGTTPVTKAEVKEVIGRAKTMVDAYAATLTDEDLGKENAGLSARIGASMTHAGCLALVASHNQYHFGACDAALRHQGLPGIF